jgi:hypothetical protein
VNKWEMLEKRKRSLKKDLRFFYGTRESRIFKTTIVISLPTLKVDFVQNSISESRALLPGLWNCLLFPQSLLNPFVSEKRGGE